MLKIVIWCSVAASFSLLGAQRSSWAMAPAPAQAPVTPVPTPALSSAMGQVIQHNAFAITAQDKITQTTDGKPAYTTAHDGAVYQLLSPADIQAVPVTRVPISMGILNKILVDQSRRMLDEEGQETPVKYQQGPSCQTFAAVGALEAAYKRQYGLTLDLSEHYLINMGETGGRPLNWARGSASGALATAMNYGVAPTADWPAQNFTRIYSDLRAVLNPPATDTNSAVDGIVWNDPLQRDVANFNPLLYPSLQSHEDAKYAPQEVSWVPNPKDPASYEQLIQQGHEIAVIIPVSQWKLNTVTGIFDFNPAPARDGLHNILITGYDRNRRVFRIKNSWGANWNGNGYADLSYDLITQAGSNQLYIASVRPPTQGAIGSGVWRGFWRAKIGGVSGTAVIRHMFLSSVAPDVSIGTFYADNGSVIDIPQLLAGDAFSATIGDALGSPKYTLKRDPSSIHALYKDSLGQVADWYKCSPDLKSNAFDLSISSYQKTRNNPFALPPCSGAIHHAPTQCSLSQPIPLPANPTTSIKSLSIVSASPSSLGIGIDACSLGSTDGPCPDGELQLKPGVCFLPSVPCPLGTYRNGYGECTRLSIVPFQLNLTR
jgi:hypothetical protein